MKISITTVRVLKIIAALARKKKKNLKKNGRKEGHLSRKIVTQLMKVLFESDL